MGMLGDMGLIMISQRKEEKRIKEGRIKNKNLPDNIQNEKITLEMAANKGDVNAAYKLGSMYIEGDRLGYDPVLAEKYLKIGAAKNSFNCNYALALFYRGEWSYCHNNDYKSYLHFVAASKCKCNEPKFMEYVQHMLKNEIHISTKERDKNGNPMVWYEHEIKIK